MSNPHQQLIQFVLEKSSDEPVRKRIVLYQAVRDLCGDEREAGQLTNIIKLLEGAEKSFAQLQMDFFKHLQEENK